jgi:hypothetical protein
MSGSRDRAPLPFFALRAICLARVRGVEPLDVNS